jgi:hypothetical protein
MLWRASPCLACQRLLSSVSGTYVHTYTHTDTAYARAHGPRHGHRKVLRLWPLYAHLGNVRRRRHGSGCRAVAAACTRHRLLFQTAQRGRWRRPELASLYSFSDLDRRPSSPRAAGRCMHEMAHTRADGCRAHVVVVDRSPAGLRSFRSFLPRARGRGCVNGQASGEVPRLP